MKGWRGWRWVWELRAAASKTRAASENVIFRSKRLPNCLSRNNSASSSGATRRREKRLALRPESAIFRRVFLSDAMNQAVHVRGSGLFGAPDEGPVAVSIVQQAPAQGAKIALLAYHVASDAPIAKRELGRHHTLVEMGGRRHLWSTRLVRRGDVGPASAADQTREVFGDLIAALAGQGGTLRDHCVRTWLYLKDVDVFYQDMVKSRTDLFRREGLTADTHYIASTGIEGACAHRYDLVAMDAYSVLGLVGRADFLPQRFRPPLRDEGLRRHLRARDARRLWRSRAYLHLRDREHRRRGLGRSSRRRAASTRSRARQRRSAAARGASGPRRHDASDRLSS